MRGFLEQVFFWGIFLSLFLGHLLAQQPYLLSYGTHEGLPSSEVYALCQDRLGYLWIGTDRGAVRFSGLEMRHFGIKDGLPNNLVREFYEDEAGRIWFINLEYEGLPSYWDGEAVRQIPKRLAPQGFWERLGLANYAILVDTAKSELLFKPAISICLEGGEDFCQKTYAVDIKTGQWRVMENLSNDFPFFDQAHLGPRVGAGVLFNPETQFESKVKPWEGLRAWRKVKLSRFNYWLFLHSQGLLILDERGEKLLYACTEAWAKNLTAICEDEQGDLWLGGRGGLYRIRRQWRGGELSFGPPQILSLEHYVTDLLEDRTGNIWFSTWDAGLFCYPQIRPKQFISPKVSNTKVYALHLDTLDQNLYFADASGQIWQSSKLEQGFQAFGPPPPPRWGIQALWLDANAKRLRLSPELSLKLREKTWQKQKLNFDLKPIKKHLVQDPKQETYYLGTSQGWLLLNAQDSLLIHSANDLDFKHRTEGLWLEKDSLWIGSMKGIFCYAQGKIHGFASEFPPSQHRCSDISKLDSSLIFATHGMGLLSLHQGRWQQWTENQGLISNTIHRVLVENRFQIWLATDKGLQCLHLYPRGDSLDVLYRETFSTHNGLPSNEIFNLVIWDKHLVLATAKGLVWLSLERLHRKKRSPELYWKSFQVWGENRRFKPNQVIELAAEDNQIRISVETVGYGEAKFTYRYHLLGQDPQAQYSENPFFTYTNLQAKTYELRVSVAGSDGVFSPEHSLHFKILPHFTQTSLFFLLCLLLGLMVLGLAFWLSLSYFKRQAETEQQVLLLEIKALRAQMNPHFLFNSLNSIAFLISENASDTALSYLSKFSRLLRLVLENSRQNSLSLDKEIDFLRLYIELEQKRFSQAFGLEITCPIAKDKQRQIRIPPMLIQPFVENALLHGLMNHQGQGLLRLSFELNNNKELEIQIQDNGIGRKAAAAIAAKRQGRASVGVLNTLERLAQLSRVHGKTFSLVIEDLYQDSGQACGTLVKLTLPLKQEDSAF